jgi:glutaryl-CoA dehydrogenase
MSKDLFQHPDYFLVDELLTDEQKLIRDSVRAWVKKEVSPIIEDYAQRAEFPKQLIKGLAELGCFGPTIPPEYGGAGLDYISYGLMMQEIERGDSGVRSTASVQGSLVMFPIYAYGSEEQRKKIPAETRQRRMDGVLWTDGTRLRVEPLRYDHEF